MARWLLFALLWLGAAGAAAAAPKGQAVVTARLILEGVHATVALDRPVTRFAFEAADVVREGEFEVLTPGLALKGDEVTSAQPFRRFEVRIRPMTGERDAKYPAHYRVGEGGVIYAPALQADSEAWRTRMTFAPAPGQLRLPASGDLSRGFVYLGPPDYRSEHEGITMVVAPGTPDWLVERTRADLAGAVTAFTRALKAPLPRRPLLILKNDSVGGGLVADVTPGAVIAIRTHGAPLEAPDATAQKLAQGLVLHEAFHLWNGDLAGSAEGAPTWLHEGGAEYASLLGGLASGVLDEGDVRRRLSQALSRCRDGMGAKSMTELGFLSNRVRYPCGMVLQWAADLHLRRASGGTRGVLDAWADTIRIARSRPSREYSLGDFYAAAGLDPARLPAAMTLVAEGSGMERWSALPAALSQLGAQVEHASTPENRLQGLAFHLLGQNCAPGTPFGYFGQGETIRIDSTPERCGVLAGGPVIVAIEGAKPFELGANAYEAAQRRCADKRPITFRTADGRDLAVPCKAPLPDAPRGYVVSAWRPSATPTPGS